MRGRQGEPRASRAAMELRMTAGPGFDLERLVATNASAACNRLAGFEVVAAGGGEVELRMPWRDDLTQYAGHFACRHDRSPARHRLRLCRGVGRGLRRRIAFLDESPETCRGPMLHRQRHYAARRTQAGLRPRGIVCGERTGRDVAGRNR